MYKITFFILLLVTTSVAEAQDRHPTKSIEPYYDLSFTDAERDSMQGNLESFKKAYEELHAYKMDNSDETSFHFSITPSNWRFRFDAPEAKFDVPKSVELPANKEDLAFYPVYKLAALIKSRKITSTELTSIYIARIKKYSDTLQCVITLLEERAMRDAKKADDLIRRKSTSGHFTGFRTG